MKISCIKETEGKMLMIVRKVNGVHVIAIFSDRVARDGWILVTNNSNDAHDEVGYDY